MPIKGTTDPWVDAIAGVTLLITNLANRWRHFQLALLLIVMYQTRRICNFFHACGKVSPLGLKLEACWQTNVWSEGGEGVVGGELDGVGDR